jgi:hypothetical protein
VKLRRVAKDCFLFQLGRQEERLLLDLLQLYPRIPPAHLVISKSGNLPDQKSSQKLLDDALAEQREENKHRVQKLITDRGRWTEDNEVVQTSLGAGELDWLLQILNDIRIGSWVILGSPEELFEVVNQDTAPHLWAMEMAGLFQMYLIHALEEEGC